MPGRAPRARGSQGRGKKQSEKSRLSPVNPPSSDVDAILVDLPSLSADSLTVPQFPQRGGRPRGQGKRSRSRVSRVLERPSNTNAISPPQSSTRRRGRAERNRSRPVTIFLSEPPPITGSLSAPRSSQRSTVYFSHILYLSIYSTSSAVYNILLRFDETMLKLILFFMQQLGWNFVDVATKKCPFLTLTLLRCTEGGRGRSQGERNRSRPSRIPRNQQPPNRNSLSARRSSQRRSRRNVQPRARPTVISLDVTYSSDELESEIPSSPEKEPDSLLNFTLTASSDGAQSSDDDIRPHTSSPIPSPVKEEVEEDTEENKDIQDWSSDYEEDDILFVDYNAKRDAALKRAFTEIRKMEKEETAAKKVESPNDKSSCDPVTQLDDEEASEKKSGDLDISCLDSPVKIPRKKRKGRETVKKALESLKQFSEELSRLKADGSFNGDIMVLSDEDDDTENEIITLFVKFESNYIRCRVRRFQKFSSVYDDVADRLSLNVAQVLLCHDDKVISRDKCPVDLKLKYGDIIECGVQSQSAVQVKETVTKQSPGTIPLKVQNSDRKGVVTIFIGLDAKMKELMHRYAEEKNIPVEELHFSFDGETLNPSDTPKSLDLEGNECIDVYRK